jgi:hypothetical protein
MIYNGKPIPFIMNHMDIQGRILQSLRPRRDGILLRSDLKALGSDSQISAALVELRRKGVIQRIERGVYAQPAKLAALGKSALLERAHWRQEQARNAAASRSKRQSRTLTPTARYVIALAKRVGVAYVPTFSDRWALAVTRLACDEVPVDATDDLLVALTRAGKLPPGDMVKLVMAHHRALKSQGLRLCLNGSARRPDLMISTRIVCGGSGSRGGVIGTAANDDSLTANCPRLRKRSHL